MTAKGSPNAIVPQASDGGTLTVATHFPSHLTPGAGPAEFTGTASNGSGQSLHLIYEFRFTGSPDLEASQLHLDYDQSTTERPELDLDPAERLDGRRRRDHRLLRTADRLRLPRHRPEHHPLPGIGRLRHRERHAPRHH